MPQKTESRSSSLWGSGTALAVPLLPPLLHPSFFFFFFCLGPFSKGRSVKKKEHLQSCQEDYHTSIRSVGSFGCVLVMM